MINIPWLIQKLINWIFLKIIFRPFQKQKNLSKIIKIYFIDIFIYLYINILSIFKFNFRLLTYIKFLNQFFFPMYFQFTMQDYLWAFELPPFIVPIFKHLYKLQLILIWFPKHFHINFFVFPNRWPL